ncbi:CehA/McbA family metallohydrolase [Paenibacillus sp. 1P07SE]|uniref:CehA/McbA family metallohydrolase n=1 Tax=Paenibacillus sp. 1P07SE TaxID=3132209 RepID=UPI0039A6B218
MEDLQHEDEQTVLLSRGKRAWAEQEVPGHEANQAVDGRADTCWAGAPYYKWWKVDLGSLCRIDRLFIRTQAENDADNYTRYFIETSPDDLNWTLAADRTDVDAHDKGAGQSYDTALTARYVRVTLTYCSSGETVRIYDFQVYGKALAEQQPAVDRSAPHKFAAVHADEVHGFETAEADDIEPGATYPVLRSGTAGSYLAYRGVDLSKQGVDQLRGMFGFSDLDKSKRVTLEVRLDRPDGELAGELVLFKQWKRWSNLAGQLSTADPARLAGIRDIYLVLREAAPGQELMIHWLAFARGTALPEPAPRSEALPAPEGEYRIYFGNLHSHTGLSDGIGTPDEAYDHARYEAGLDFLAITEHSNLYDHDLDWNRSRKWVDIQQTAARKTEDGRFLALYGAETTWYNQFGHMNTYNMDCFINAYEIKYNDIAHYYHTIKQYPDSIQQWNHPWSCGNRHLDGFDPYDAELDEVMHTIEINTIESKELGGLYYYVMALDKGWHVAPVGSQDNHHGQWGSENTLRTGILVDKLTTEDFYDALRHQRAYFTSALHLNVWFRVNGAIMGSRIPRTETIDIEINALYSMPTDQRIVRMEIIGEGGRVLHAIDQDGDELDYRVSLAWPDRYCFVKIYQEDGEFAATAPVWLED